jgi:hypothetical protein
MTPVLQGILTKNMKRYLSRLCSQISFINYLWLCLGQQMKKNIEAWVRF